MLLISTPTVSHLNIEGPLDGAASLHHVLDHVDGLLEPLVGRVAEQLLEAQPVVGVTGEVA